jgi:hypothetical protein
MYNSKKKLKLYYVSSSFSLQRFFSNYYFWVDKLHKLDYLNVVRKIGLKSKSDQAMNNLMDNF